MEFQDKREIESKSFFACMLVVTGLMIFVSGIVLALSYIQNYKFIGSGALLGAVLFIILGGLMIANGVQDTIDVEKRRNK